MSFGTVEGEPGAAVEALTVAEIDGHPFGAIRFTGQRWALPDVRLLSPILPSKVVGIGRNYVEHAAEHRVEVPQEPLLFLKPSTAIIGQHDLIRLPVQSRQVEHEAELAVVIGAPGARRVDRAGARAAIFGYTCGNDVTARDLQRSDGQWTRGKGFDTFCPVGPFVSDEVRPEALDLETRVNGEVRQKGNTRDFIFSLPAIVRYISSLMTLLSGDLILTGTPAGVGPVKEDDRVEVSISGLGTLTNFVVAEERWASSEIEKMRMQPQEFRGR